MEYLRPCFLQDLPLHHCLLLTRPGQRDQLHLDPGLRSFVQMSLYRIHCKPNWYHWNDCFCWTFDKALAFPSGLVRTVTLIIENILMKLKYPNSYNLYNKNSVETVIFHIFLKLVCIISTLYLILLYFFSAINKKYRYISVYIFKNITCMFFYCMKHLILR